uniref:Uncharacterized protein n=1 Tax=Phytophthora ramorum TaxID=164328 RepID=H3HAJ5_PHYRM
MVRVPGSSGNSQGFHRESTQEDVKSKIEPGMESSTEDGSPSTALKAPGSSDRQSAGRSSDDAKEAGSEMDLEEKPYPPPQAPTGAPADHDANRDPPDEGPTVKTEGLSSTTTPPTSRSAPKKKSKTSRMKMKAPESGVDKAEGRTVPYSGAVGTAGIAVPLAGLDVLSTGIACGGPLSAVDGVMTRVAAPAATNSSE